MTILIDHIKNIFESAAKHLLSEDEKEERKLTNDKNYKNDKNEKKETKDEKEAFESTLYIAGLQLFNSKYINLGDKEEALAKSFVNQFYKLKWNDLFGCHDPENFIRNYIKELPIEYYAKFIKYYMNEFIDKYKSIFLLQSDLLKTEEFILDPDIFTDHAIVLTQKEIFPEIGRAHV